MEQPYRTPEQQELERRVDEMILASDIAIHGIMNKILERVRQQALDEYQEPNNMV